MLTFNSLILVGLILRTIFVIIGIIGSIKIIGVKNIQFLFGYIQKSFFSVKILFTWVIAFLSIIYFEHLVSDARGISIIEVFSNNVFLALITVLLLISILIYAFIDAKKSFIEAKKTKDKLQSAKNFKMVANTVSVTSWLIPGGLLVKGGVFALSLLGKQKIDNEIEKNVSSVIVETLKVMLIIAMINLTIIILSTYLITGQILFW